MKRTNEIGEPPRQLKKIRQGNEAINEGKKLRLAVHSRFDTIAERKTQKYIEMIYAKIMKLSEYDRLSTESFDMLIRDYKLCNPFAKRKIVKKMRDQGICCYETSRGILYVKISF